MTSARDMGDPPNLDESMSMTYCQHFMIGSALERVVPMSHDLFDTFFQGQSREFLLAAIRTALSEDGPDLTSEAVFGPEDMLHALIVAKEAGVLAGLPIVPLVLAEVSPQGRWAVQYEAADGQQVAPGQTVARLCGPAAVVLRAERSALNFLCHLSGVATATASYARKLAGTRTRLLDTRKTLPGLRYPEKYAVRVGGGRNHRLNLVEMLMLKDNHIDRAGSITRAVQLLRGAYSPCPPMEVECRNLDEVKEAVSLGVSRIMFDNMTLETMREALTLVPTGIETEVSGGVNLDTIADIGRLGPDFVSVGALTHSAKALDLSMRVLENS